MFEGPVTGNIPEVLDNGEVTDGTHVTAGQLALALTPYAQVTDLAVNTAAAGNNAAAIQSLDNRVTAVPPSWTAARWRRRLRPWPRRRPWPPRTGRWPRTEAASPRCSQSAFDVLEGVVATKSTPDSVDLKLSNYSTTAAMNGSIASANNATLATVAANYGLKTVVDQHSLDIAARITPLEVDTKVANALLGAVTAALASELASRDATRPWTLPPRWTQRSRPLSWAPSPRQPWTPPSPARRTPARWPPCSPRWTDFHWR